MFILNIIEAFKSFCRYLDDLLNIDNPYFEGMAIQIYPPELQLKKADTSHIEVPFLNLHIYLFLKHFSLSVKLKIIVFSVIVEGYI